MLIREKISVNVIFNGKQFKKTISITSDGSYDQVNGIVHTYVYSVWKDKKIDKIFWNYA